MIEDQIEAVICRHNMRIAKPRDNLWTCRCGETPHEYAKHLAEVIVKELGLRQEWITEQGRLLGIVQLRPSQEAIAQRIGSAWVELYDENG